MAITIFMAWSLFRPPATLATRNPMNLAGPGGTAAGIDRRGNNQGLCQVAADDREHSPIKDFA
jgi:hypothetical protein